MSWTNHVECSSCHEHDWHVFDNTWTCICDKKMTMAEIGLFHAEEDADPKRHPFSTNEFPVETCLKCGFPEQDHDK